MAQFFPKVAQKAPYLFLLFKCQFLNRTNVWATFVRKFVAQFFLKIAQSGHTGVEVCSVDVKLTEDAEIEFFRRCRVRKFQK